VLPITVNTQPSTKIRSRYSPSRSLPSNDRGSTQTRHASRIAAAVASASPIWSWHMSNDSGQRRFAFHIPSESVFTSLRNPYSEFPGMLIHLVRIPHSGHLRLVLTDFRTKLPYFREHPRSVLKTWHDFQNLYALAMRSARFPSRTRQTFDAGHPAVRSERVYSNPPSVHSYTGCSNGSLF